MYNNGHILLAEDIRNRILALVEFNRKLYIFHNFNIKHFNV